MQGGVLVGTGWGEIQISAYTFQGSDKQLYIVSLEIINQILYARDGPLMLDEFELGELADVLQVATAFIVDHEVSVDVVSEFLVIDEERLHHCLLDVTVV